MRSERRGVLYSINVYRATRARAARRHRDRLQEKGIDGGGERSHRSLSPSANRHAQLAGPTHPPQTRRSHPHCPPARREVPRAVAAPSPALLVSKSTAVDSVTTWVLRLRRDGHIGSSSQWVCAVRVACAARATRDARAGGARWANAVRVRMLLASTPDTSSSGSSSDPTRSWNAHAVRSSRSGLGAADQATRAASGGRHCP
eukprot:COSAG02_NODE_1558_length_11928_cov_4.044974_16_plen_202_part_00